MATGSAPRGKRIVTSALGGVLPSTARPAPPWAARKAGDDYGAPATPDWRDVDWTDRVRDVEIEGRRIRYAELGEAGAADGVPPVVFVHGLGGDWQNWLENLPAAAAGRRALALDLPGFGSSEMPAEKISIAGYARIVDGWCEQLGLGQVVIVGNSMGGFIGAELAISYPWRVERLALVAAAGISITNLRRRPAMTLMRINTVLGAWTIARSKDVIVRKRLRHATLWFVMRHPARIPSDLLYEVLLGMGARGFMPAMDALLSYDFRDRISEIACPTLVVWGREDMLVPVRDAEEYERLVPHSRKIVMDDTGHVPMIERPLTFNRHLLDFLGEETGAGAGETRAGAERGLGEQGAPSAVA